MPLPGCHSSVAQLVVSSWPLVPPRRMPDDRSLQSSAGWRSGFCHPAFAYGRQGLDTATRLGQWRPGIAYHSGTAPAPYTAGGAIGAALRSEEHTSELQSLMCISYAVFCLKKKK